MKGLLNIGEMSDEKFTYLVDNALDITGATVVGIQISRDRKVLWVNVDGVCVLRVCRVQNLFIKEMGQNERKPKSKIFDGQGRETCHLQEGVGDETEREDSDD